METIGNGRAGDKRGREIVEHERSDAAQALLAAIVSSSDDAIIGKTIDGVIMSWNRGAELLYGYSADEAIGRSIEIIVPADRRGEVRDILQRIRRGERVDHRDTMRVTRDGRMVEVSITVSPIVDPAGHIIGASTIARDISEHRRVEEALRESEEKFRQMAENIGEVFFIFSPDWKRTIYVSPAYERVWGRPLADVYRDPIDWLEGVHPDDRGLPLAVVQRNVGGDVSGNDQVEFRVLRPDGSVRWIYARTFPIRGEQGKLTGITGIAEDITERKRAEAAIADAEGFKRSILDALPSNIAVLDGDGVIVYVNKSWINFAIRNGAKVDNVPDVGVNYLDVCRSAAGPDSEEASLALEGMLAVMMGDRETFELEYPCHSPDTRRWFRMRVTPFRGAHPGIVVYHDDITQRKLAEDALADSRGMMQLVIDNIPEAIFWKDVDSVYLGCNEVLARDVGLKSPEDVVGKTDYDLSTTREQTESYRAYDRMVMDRDEPIYHIIEMQRRADGTLAWLDTSKIPLHDESGKVIGILCTYEDITERKKAEQALNEAKAQAELYLDLMGHDINNMHQIALGYLEMAQGLAPGLQQEEMIGRSIEVLQRSTQLIRNVRKLQKLNEDFLQMHEVDVGGVLHAVQREFGSVPDKNVKLNFHSEGHCFVRANELLHDVFANLVSNAIKHTGDKADIAMNMDIVAENGRKHCRVNVEDNGPGVPDDFKDKIFSRLLRGTNKVKGMGLGLYVVKSLVDSYGGRVWVEDRVKGDYTKGARFVVTLPAVE